MNYASFQEHSAVLLPHSAFLIISGISSIFLGICSWKKRQDLPHTGVQSVIRMATIAAAAFGCPQFDCCCSISVPTEPRPTLTIHANEGAKVHCSSQFLAGASGFNACSLCPCTCPCPCNCHSGLCELDVGWCQVGGGHAR